MEALFATLLELHDGDLEATHASIDQLLEEQQSALEEANAEVQEGYSYQAIAANLVETREHAAYLTQREFYKELAVKDPHKAWEAYYSARPVEAAEDSITEPLPKLADEVEMENSAA